MWELVGKIHDLVFSFQPTDDCTVFREVRVETLGEQKDPGMITVTLRTPHSPEVTRFQAFLDEHKDLIFRYPHPVKVVGHVESYGSTHTLGASIGSVQLSNIEGVVRKRIISSQSADTRVGCIWSMDTNPGATLRYFQSLMAKQES